MISVKNYVVLDKKIYIIGVIPISEHRGICLGCLTIFQTEVLQDCVFPIKENYLYIATPIGPYRVS